jgi:hypothetical protein
MRLPTLAAIVPVATLIIAALAGNARAQECGMGAVDWYGAERANVARADELLKAGEPKKAAALLQKMWPEIHDAVPVAGSIPVIADGVRLMALAVVRADGDVPFAAGWSSWTAGERARNVAWGVRRLRMLTKADPTDTIARTDLGEALSRSPETREEAGTILEALDTAHAMGSAEGYAALALVRSENGDAVGAEAASDLCERRASSIAQCTALGARVTPAVTAAR